MRRKAKSRLSKKKADDNSSYWCKKADQAWGEYAHGCADHCAFDSCNVGECAGKLEAHHLITRAVRSLRHDPSNAIILCSLHHKYSTKASPHQAPLGFAFMMQTRYPLTWEWVKQNQWKIGTHNYKQAYENLQQLMNEVDCEQITD